MCADFGCHAGGFTDCLLQHGAAHVYAIDTGYGVLEYKLRIDSRVTVMERTNVLHVRPPDDPVDVVTIDVAWTKQQRVLPVALKWLKTTGRIITLIKPHYELSEHDKRELLRDGQLESHDAARVLERVLDEMPSIGAAPITWTRSPITGAKSSRRQQAGNVEFLVLCAPVSGEDSPQRHGEHRER